MAEHIDVSIRDPERALPLLREYFPDVRMNNPQGGFILDLAASEVEKFSLVHWRLRSTESSSSADFSETLTFGQVSQGQLGLDASNRSIDTTRPWLFPQHHVHANWDDVTITALSLSMGEIVQFARAQIGNDAAALTFIGNAPIDRARGKQWALLVDYTRSALDDESPLITLPLVRANAFALLSSTLLATFPNSITESTRNQPRPSSLPGSVRRATAFIESNAHLPITIEDIARESLMSIRGLQYAFRRHLDTTPVDYLRRTRLAGAHDELRVSDPMAGATVQAIAAAWGFLNPGRFARLHRDAYGVTPRRTLEN